MPRKILLICDLFPYPPHRSGGCSTMYSFLSTKTASNYEITVLHFEQEYSDKKCIENLDVEVRYVKVSGMEFSCKIGGKRIIKSKSMKNICAKRMPEIDVSKFDYVIFASITATCIIDKLIQREHSKIILFEADSPVMFYERELTTTKNPLRKLYNKLQMKVVQNYEKEICKEVDKIVFVSEVDREYAARYLGSAKTQTVKLGVKHLGLKEAHGEKDVIHIGFSGKMDYKPNFMASTFIINEIMPCLDLLKAPYVIHLIGGSPAKEWTQISHENDRLIVTGYVDDIHRYIAGMDIFISPLFLGSGMKNKILEALSTGVPVIASEVSVEGIDGMVESENYVLCDKNPENWARAIVNLYQNIDKRRSIAEKGKELVETLYSWERFAEELVEG